MKKIILLASLLLTTLTQAQISVEGNGETIPNGYVYTTNKLQPMAAAELKLTVTNTSANPINLKLRIEEMTNAPGSAVQFCFGEQCYDNVTIGKTVPSNNTEGGFGLTLAPGASNTEGDHFWNNNPGIDTNAPVKYKIAVIQYTNEGVIIGDPLFTFTYIYDKNFTAGTADFASLKNIGITLNSTVVKNSLDVTATQNAKLEMFNINGQIIKTAAITNGSQSVDVSGLSNGVYITRFTNEENKTSQIRVVKN
jgi:hypothetical protein